MGWNGGDINCPNCDDPKSWWLENDMSGPKYFVCGECGFTGKGLGNVWVGDFVITHGALIDRFKGVDLEELNLSVIRDAANGLSPGLRLSSGYVEVMRFGEYADDTQEKTGKEEIMDPECFVLLNTILQELASLDRPIENLEEIPISLANLSDVPSSSLIHASDPKDIEGQVNDIRELLEDARTTGIIHEWEVERDDGGKVRRWDWSTKAYQQAESMGITLVNPLVEGKREDGL